MHASVRVFAKMAATTYRRHTHSHAMYRVYRILAKIINILGGQSPPCA